MPDIQEALNKCASEAIQEPVNNTNCQAPPQTYPLTNSGVGLGKYIYVFLLQSVSNCTSKLPRLCYLSLPHASLCPYSKAVQGELGFPNNH